MILSVTGLNHKTAPVEVREQVAFSVDVAERALSRLLSGYGAAEAVLLSTCNRVEMYCVRPAEQRGEAHELADFFADFFHVPRSVYETSLYSYEGEKAARHLFRVASSLDSMVVGEPQILGQVKEWFHLCVRQNAVGGVLNELFQRALQVGKKVRSETMIGRSAVSVPYAAVELAKKIFSSLEGKKVTLLGTGKMSEVTVRNLVNAGVREIWVVSRSEERAESAAGRLGARPRLFDADYHFLGDTDILIASAGAPHFLITKDRLQRLMVERKQQLLFIIDIAVPRNVDPAVNELENVYLYNIDDLEQIVQRNRAERMKEMEKGEEIVEAAVVQFASWLASLEITPALKVFRGFLEQLRAGEVERLIAENARFDAEQREAIEYFSRALINKIAHAPTERLKKLASTGQGYTYAELLRKLFEADHGD
jgi:glutamyl-tRNA reductase